MHRIAQCFITKEELQQFDDTFKYYYKRHIIDDYFTRDQYYNHTKKIFKKYPTKLYDMLVVWHTGVIFSYRDQGALEKYLKLCFSRWDKNWVAMGNIINEYESTKLHNPKLNPDPAKKYFKIWPQMTVINLHAWHKIGRPNIGAPTSVNGMNLVKVKCADKCIHDNYTPLHIKKGKGYHSDKTFNVNEGWNLINEALSKKHTIRNLMPELRGMFNYTYPDDDYNQYIISLKKYHREILKTQPNDKVDIGEDGHEKLLKKLNVAKTNTFKGDMSVFNSEDLVASNLNQYWENIKDVDCIVCPTQGFKDMVYSYGKHKRILKPFNNENCDYIHYDFIDKKINQKKKLTEEWNGEYETLNAISGIVHYDMKNYNKICEYVPNFQSTFKKYKNHTHKYVQANLIYDPQPLIDLIKKGGYKKIFFMYSDIYPWQHNIILYGANNLTKMQQNLGKALLENADEVYMEGKNIQTGFTEISKIG